MNVRNVISTGVIAALFLGVGLASAQVVGTPSGSAVMVTTTPVTTSPGPGTNGATFASVAISGNSGANYSLTSIPITVTPSSGAAASDLSSCQLINSSGSALNSGSNLTGALSSGSNTITLNSPLVITGGAGSSTFTVRCNVSSSALTNATYQIIAGDPVFTSTTTSTSGSLGVSLNMIPTVPAGTQNAVIGVLGLDAGNSGSNVTVSSVPVTFSFNGNSPSDFTGCALRSASALGTALNTGTNAVTAISTTGATTFTLDTPMNIEAGSSMLVALTCDVASGTPTGSSVTASVDPANVLATAATGAITPSTDVSSSGAVSPTSGNASITAPSTTTTTPPATTGTTPGAPNTGAGGNAASSILLLTLAALAAIAGGTILLRSGLFSLEQ